MDNMITATFEPKTQTPGIVESGISSSRALVINRPQNHLTTERSVDFHAQIQKENRGHRGSRRR